VSLVLGALLFTGFPGAIGSSLLPMVLADRPDDHAVCLVQPRWAGLAKRRADEIAAGRPELDGRIRLVEGDITVAGLDLAGLTGLQRDVVEVWHLAAAYDLKLDRAAGLLVNVDGTRHVLDVAAGCDHLRRMHHMSTCYVSGRWAGVATEADLVRGQVFNNSYEETKFLAEVEVQARMAQGMPVTVYRPAIVTGDSRTGEARKYDGAYYFIRLLERQGRVAVVPIVGDPAMTRMNIVPRDFVTAAMAHLSTLERSAGRVYQLADPDPLTVDELLDELGRATGRRLVRVLVGRRTAKTAIRRVPGVDRVVGVPAATIDYLVHPTHYATDNMRADLAGSGIRVPPLPSYLPRLVAYVRAHPEISDAAMV
jgi:thioester reductase-like protein